MKTVEMTKAAYLDYMRKNSRATDPADTDAFIADLTIALDQHPHTFKVSVPDDFKE